MTSNEIMQEDIIYKLKALQTVEPTEAWKEKTKRRLMGQVSGFGVQNDIYLSSKDIYARKEKTGAWQLLTNRMAVGFASFAVLLTSSVLTVEASQSSLPGDPLYQIKKAGEQVALAVASDRDRPKVEIEQAGKRLEELAQISQRASDSSQHQKVEQLVNDYREKVSSANEHLTQLGEKGKASGTGTEVASVARVVTEQSEKYTQVLQKTTDSLPDTVKVKVAVQVADAAKETEKTNIAALLVIADVKPDALKDQDIADKIQKTIEKAEEKVNSMTEKTTVAVINGPETGTGAKKDAINSEETKPAATIEAEALTEEAKKELEKAKENLSNNNLADTLKNVMAVSEMSDKVNAPVMATPPVENPVIVETTLQATGQTTKESGN